MINFTFRSHPSLAIAVVSADEPVYYSLAAAAQASGVHPDLLRYYLRLGLIDAQQGTWADEPYFDHHALADVQRLGHYRRHLGVSRRALPLICELRRAGQRQHIELRFLEGP